MKSFGITDRGKVRRDNQDSFLIERIDEKDCLIAVLCDCMGGEKAGNIASDLAAKTYVGELSQKMKITAEEAGCEGHDDTGLPPSEPHDLRLLLL